MRRAMLLGSLAVLAIGLAGSASADPWKDESGHGRGYRHYERHYDDWRPRRHYYDPRYERRAYREEYRRGGCKIERKWDRGGYKEKVKCKRRDW
jgi:hypothetical protein